MTVAALIDALKKVDCPADAEVLFSIPDEDEIEQRCCLVPWQIEVESAHDEDCTPFVRVSLE